MAENSSLTLNVPEREGPKVESGTRHDSLPPKQQQQKLEARKLTKREFCLIIVIIVLTLVICGLVGFIIGWFLWPHSPDQMPESGRGVQDRPVDTDDVRIVNESMNGDDVVTSREDNRTVCLTSSCLRAGLNLLDTMDTSVDPCRDFKGYSCGSLHTANAIFPPTKRQNLHSILQGNVNKRVLKLLKAKVGRIGHRSSERKVKQLFATCLNAASAEKQWKQNFIKILKEMGGWPALGLWNREMVRGWKLSLPLEKLHFTFDIPALFTWRLIPDVGNTSKYIIQLSHGGLTLPDGTLYLGNYSSPVLTSYRKFLRTAATLSGSLAKPANRFVNDVFSFEKKLAKISTDSGAETSRRLPVKALVVICPEVDWRSFFRQFPGVNLSTEVLVDNLHYFANMSRVMAASYPRILQNYMAWRFLYKVMPFMSQKFLNVYNEMDMVVTDRTESRGLQDYCLHLAETYMGSAIGAVYIRDGKQHLVKRDVTDMSEKIKEVLINTIDKIEWMDDVTRDFASDKLEMLQVEAAFPDYLYDTSFVDTMYADINAQKTQSFFDAFFNVSRGKVQRVLKRTGESVDITQYTWEDSSWDTVHISYNSRTNVIVVPAGLLQPPVFDRSLPDVANYGTLGPVIGTEMMKSLVDEGSNFDQYGNLDPWWTNVTSENFENLQRCLWQPLNPSDVVSARSDKSKLSDDIAEIGGLILSYKALKTVNHDERIIPGANLTTDQALFVSFAQSRCSHPRSSILFKVLEKPSVIGMPEIADDFKCFPETSLISDEVCSIL